MYHGLNFGASINPWTEHQERPWRSRGFFLTSQGTLVLGVVGVLATFTTSELAVRLCRIRMADPWSGSANMQLFLRARGAVLDDYFQQWTHDIDQGHVVQRIDALCPPFSQIELSALSQTDSGNDRPIALWLTGWLEQWPESRDPIDRWKGGAA